MTTQIILAGFGGQGILFAGKLLAYAGMLNNKEVSWLPSYGPEMRGGTANCHVIISDKQVASPIIQKPDVLIALNGPSLEKFENSVVSGGTIIYDASLIASAEEKEGVNIFGINATETAIEMGARNLANMVMLGKLIKETDVFTLDQLKEALKKLMPPSKVELYELNCKILDAGYSL